MVDAPLSGGPARAGTGDLLIVVGARPAALTKVQALVAAYATNKAIVDESSARAAVTEVTAE